MERYRERRSMSNLPCFKNGGSPYPGLKFTLRTALIACLPFVSIEQRKENAGGGQVRINRNGEETESLL